MAEEVLQPGAEVVESRLAVGVVTESILGAAAVASETHVALETGPRQRVALVQAELQHLG